MEINMNEEKKDRRVRRTKKQLEEALLRLLETKTIHEISVRELADAADVTRATFYTHYRDPLDMLTQMQKLIQDDIIALINETTGRDPEKFFLQLFRYLQKDVAHPEILFIAASKGSAFEQFGNIIFDNYMLHWIPENTKISRMDYEYYRSYTIFGCIAVTKRWLANGRKDSPEAMTALFLNLLPRGRANLLTPLPPSSCGTL